MYKYKLYIESEINRKGTKSITVQICPSIKLISPKLKEKNFAAH